MGRLGCAWSESSRCLDLLRRMGWTFSCVGLFLIAGFANLLAPRRHIGKSPSDFHCSSRRSSICLAKHSGEFQKTNPDIDVKVTFGSSGNFFAQITQKAPFDIYLSADVSYPEKLIEQGLAEQSSLFLYAIGQLVVWVPKDSPLEIEKKGVSVLLNDSVKKIAIANPTHAPYGRAAVAAMKSLGVYEAVEKKIVAAENIAQAGQFVESGAAQVGSSPIPSQRPRP